MVRPLRRDEEKSPRFSDALVKGPYGRPHAVTVLRRSEVRDLAGNLTAADALDRLRAHRQTAVSPFEHN